MKRLGEFAGILPCQVLSKSCLNNKIINKAIKAIPKAVICIMANPGFLPCAVIAKRRAKCCVRIRASKRKINQAAPAKITIAPPKLKPAQNVNFQSRAASAIKTALVLIPKIATHIAELLIPSNSFRIKRIGETFTKENMGGPANPISKNQEKSALQTTGHKETLGRLVRIKLPKSHVKMN